MWAGLGGMCGRLEVARADPRNLFPVCVNASDGREPVPDDGVFATWIAAAYTATVCPRDARADHSLFDTDARDWPETLTSCSSTSEGYNLFWSGSRSVRGSC